MLNILRWLLVAIPATWTNSWLSYVQNKLAIAYRSRLTNEILKEYLGDEEETSDKVYYARTRRAFEACSPSTVISYTPLSNEHDVSHLPEL